MKKNYLLLGTRKGLVVYKKTANGWTYQGVHFLGIPVSLVYVDERTATWWACLDHGHWGVKLHRSDDLGKNWEEITAPKYPEGEEIKDGVPATTKYLWAMTHAGDDKPRQLWLGTIPAGLFHSSDNGDSFELNRPLWDQPSRKEKWFGGGFDHPGIDSIVVDPRDSDHIFIAISCAGVFESTDAGKSWEVRNKGLIANFLPDPHAEVGHDPHMLVACQSNPDYLWQQNHCGIFKSEDGAKTWQDVSQKEGPANFGFAMAVNDQDAQQAWVVPAISDEIRVTVNNSLCVCRTDDGGKTWTDFRNGLPQLNSFDIVYRHGLATTENSLAFGTTTGNLFLSENYGESWNCINHYLPMIHSVIFASS